MGVHGWDPWAGGGGGRDEATVLQAERLFCPPKSVFSTFSLPFFGLKPAMRSNAHAPTPVMQFCIEGGGVGWTRAPNGAGG